MQNVLYVVAHPSVRLFITWADRSKIVEVKIMQ